MPKGKMGKSSHILTPGLLDATSPLLLFRIAHAYGVTLVEMCESSTDCSNNVKSGAGMA